MIFVRGDGISYKNMEWEIQIEVKHLSKHISVGV